MYAITAVGLTLVYGLLRILHIAHAGLFTLGGYLGLLLTNATGSLILAIPLASAAVGVVGMLMYRFCYQPMLDRPPYVPLIASLVLGIIEAFGTIYLGNLLDRDAIAFSFMSFVLMLRPHGMFSRR